MMGIWQFLDVAWVVVVLLSVIIKYRAVKAWLEPHGVNANIFAAIDLAGAVPYALAGVRLVRSIVEGDIVSAIMWGFVVLILFAAPYVYAWRNLEEAPKQLKFASMGVVILLATYAIYSVVLSIS